MQGIRTTRIFFKTITFHCEINTFFATLTQPNQKAKRYKGILD